MSAPLPPASVLYQLSVGHYVSRALHVAAKLGVADLLAAGPRSAEALAAETGTDAGALRRVMRLLASAGVFSEDADGAFSSTPLGDALRADVPGSARALVLLFAGVGLQDSWRELEWCVRTGQPAFRKHAPDGDAFSALDAEQTAIFDAAMATFAPATAAAIAAAYDFSRHASVVDVGGGNGALLVGILRAHPGVHGVVFDRPQVAAGAERHLAASGLGERCRFVAGDFFASVPAGADIYLLKHVIHDWDDDRAAAILARCREAMGAKGKVMIAEGVYPERVDTSLASRGAAANDVNMLVATGGRQRSEAEFRALYEKAGLRLVRVVPTAAPVHLIEGVPA
jgi:hypothetical protein